MRCKYPGCRKRGRKTWALVNLCEEHFGAIRDESRRYYNSLASVKYSDRVEYLKIARWIPWSRLQLGEVLPDGSVRGN